MCMSAATGEPSPSSKEADLVRRLQARYAQVEKLRAELARITALAEELMRVHAQPNWDHARTTGRHFRCHDCAAAETREGHPGNRSGLYGDRPQGGISQQNERLRKSALAAERETLATRELLAANKALLALQAKELEELRTRAAAAAQEVLRLGGNITGGKKNGGRGAALTSSRLQAVFAAWSAADDQEGGDDANVALGEAQGLLQRAQRDAEEARRGAGEVGGMAGPDLWQAAKAAAAELVAARRAKSAAARKAQKAQADVFASSAEANAGADAAVLGLAAAGHKAAQAAEAYKGARDAGLRAFRNTLASAAKAAAENLAVAQRSADVAECLYWQLFGEAATPTDDGGQDMMSASTCRRRRLKADARRILLLRSGCPRKAANMARQLEPGAQQLLVTKIANDPGPSTSGEAGEATEVEKALAAVQKLIALPLEAALGLPLLPQTVPRLSLSTRCVPYDAKTPLPLSSDGVLRAAHLVSKSRAGSAGKKAAKFCKSAQARGLAVDAGGAVLPGGGAPKFLCRAFCTALAAFVPVPSFTELWAADRAPRDVAACFFALQVSLSAIEFVQQLDRPDHGPEEEQVMLVCTRPSVDPKGRLRYARARLCTQDKRVCAARIAMQMWAQYDADEEEARAQGDPVQFLSLPHLPNEWTQNMTETQSGHLSRCLQAPWADILTCLEPPPASRKRKR